MFLGGERTQQLDEGGAGIPRVQSDGILPLTFDQINAGHRTNRNEVRLGRMKARLDKERFELVTNVFVAVL
jgi:hypothetical protein